MSLTEDQIRFLSDQFAQNLARTGDVMVTSKFIQDVVTEMTKPKPPMLRRCMCQCINCPDSLFYRSNS